jgi:hypothetical protein
MRRLLALALVLLVLTSGAAACDAPSPAAPDVSEPPSSAAPATSRSSTRPVDLVLAFTNPPGYPPCGFYTWNEQFGDQAVVLLGLGVAVTVEGANSGDVVDVDIAVAGKQTVAVQFRDGALATGVTDGFPGVPIAYLRVGHDPLDFVFDEVGQTKTVTVTVDPLNKFVETNEGNNTVTLRVRATNRRAIKITNNECTVTR